MRPTPSTPRPLVFRARAVHRLARQKRWPVYLFAALVQETPHVLPTHDPVTGAIFSAAHIGLIYLSFTLLDPL